MSQKFDPKKVLNTKDSLKFAGNHLFLYGLTDQRLDNNLKRKFIYSPRLIFIINIVSTIKCIISLFLVNNNKRLFQYTGDFVAFIAGIRIQGNLVYISFTLLPSLSQLCHYWYQRNGVNYVWLKPFSMLSGLKSPSSIGITDENDVKRLLKNSKRFLLISEIVGYFAFILSFLVSFIPLSIGREYRDIIFYSIPWSLFFGISAHYSTSIHALQVTHFHIICLYLNIKLSKINAKIKASIYRKSRNGFIESPMNSLKSLISEFLSFNEIFWSKFVAIFFLIYICLICVMLYIAIYGQMGFIIRLIGLYASLFFIAFFSLLSITASANIREFSKTYRLLNSFLLSKKFIAISLKLKVFIH